MSGVSKERATLWSGCIGLTVLAGFLGLRPKWDGATPSPSGEPTTTEAKRVVIVGYIWTSPVSPPNDNGVPLEIPLSAPVFHSHLCRDSLAVIRAVLRLFMALRGDAV